MRKTRLLFCVALIPLGIVSLIEAVLIVTFITASYQAGPQLPASAIYQPMVITSPAKVSAHTTSQGLLTPAVKPVNPALWDSALDRLIMPAVYAVIWFEGPTQPALNCPTAPAQSYATDTFTEQTFQISNTNRHAITLRASGESREAGWLVSNNCHGRPVRPGQSCLVSAIYAGQQPRVHHARLMLEATDSWNHAASCSIAVRVKQTPGGQTHE